VTIGQRYLRSIVSIEKLPPVNPRYPGNARRRLTLTCGHVVERSHIHRERIRCTICVTNERETALEKQATRIR
jgi:hypothetical protein